MDQTGLQGKKISWSDGTSDRSKGVTIGTYIDSGLHLIVEDEFGKLRDLIFHDEKEIKIESEE